MSNKRWFSEIKLSTDKQTHSPVDCYTHITVCVQYPEQKELSGCSQSDVKCLCIDVNHRRVSRILGQHHIKIVWLVMFYLWPAKELPLHISNLYCLNTVLHQRTLQGRRTTDKSEVLLPLSSNAASFVWWRISLSSDASSNLLTDSNTSPHYYMLSYMSLRLSFPSWQH